MFEAFRRRLVAKFLAWLMPTFLVASAGALYFIAERDLRQEIDFITARVGNHAGRVAAALARENVAGDPAIAADLVASLKIGRAHV